MKQFVALTVILVTTGVQALPMPATDVERNCWLRYTGERTRANFKEPTAVEFSNLRNGYQVRSPFTVEFAVRGMGVVPAGKALPGSGHHHILVDTPLPSSVTEKIPFSERHRHFGKGQTQTLLDLPPGRHTLRLLFADHEHRPHFVFSPEIVVNVLGPRDASRPRIDPAQFEATCAAWYQDELSRPRPAGDWLDIVNLRDGEAVTSPFNVRFGVGGYGVCAAGQTADKSGYFLLDVIREGRVQRTLDFSNGTTQTNLTLPNGAHVLRLRFVDTATRRELLPPSETAVIVNAQERL